MGKKIVICALLALIIGAAILEYVYVDSAVHRLTGALEQVQSALETGDNDAARRASQRLNEQWENEKQRLEALFEHNEVDVISATTKRIESFCAADDLVNARAEVSAGLFYVGHLHEMIGLRWENVF